MDFPQFPYHQAILNHEIPLSIGGGIGQSRTQMLLLRKAHLGEVTVSVCPKVLKDMCAQKNIFVLELHPRTSHILPLFFQNGHCIISTLSHSARDKKS